METSSKQLLLWIKFINSWHSLHSYILSSQSAKMLPACIKAYIIQCLFSHNSNGYHKWQFIQSSKQTNGKWAQDRGKKNHLIEFCLNETAKSLTVFCLACRIPVQVTGLGRQLLKRCKSITLSSQLQPVLADAISLPYLGFLTGDEVPAAPSSWIRKCEWTQSYVTLLIWEYLKPNPR